MLFKFLFFIFATFLAMEVNAQASIQYIPSNPAYPGKCFVEKYNMVLEFGKAYPIPRKCERMVCDLGTDNRHELTTTGCGLIAARPSCRVSEVNLRKVYPNCCPKEIC